MNILEIEDLTKHFIVPQSFVGGLLSRSATKSKTDVVHAVCHVSFSVRQSEIFGLVGESGCGKTTLSRCILRLIEPTSGRVVFDGNEMLALDKSQLRSIRGRIQMIFQDPFQSLDPRMKIVEIVGHPLELHKGTHGAETRERVAELLKLVGLSPSSMSKYPHQLSGGQRQRVAIARALSTMPQVIVADEPVSSLDVSVQSQILNNLKELRETLGLTLVFVSHDLGVVQYMSDRIGVMYLGRFAEIGPTEQVFTSPKHPYTESLLSAIPIPDPQLNARTKRIMLKGDVPSPLSPPAGCRFHTRCPYSFERCSTEEPPMTRCGDEHLAACHLLK